MRTPVKNIYSCEGLITAEDIMSNHETHGTHEIDEDKLLYREESYWIMGACFEVYTDYQLHQSNWITPRPAHQFWSLSKNRMGKIYSLNFRVFSVFRGEIKRGRLIRVLFWILTPEFWLPLFFGDWR